ncbi:TPA: P-type conjugative transfer protein TrbL, partial [Aeromonas hydrophila]
MKNRIANIIFFAGLFFCCNASAAISNRGVLDSVLDRYQSTASAWAGTMTTHATWLFWTLATISMVWTFGQMALRKADIAEFFSEFIKFTLFVGFYWWLLINGPGFASDIIDSLRQIAGEASGSAGLSPSGVVDVGFAIFDAALEKTSFWEPLDSLIAITISCIILVVLALVGINMLLMLVSAWILAFGGVFFLGFGGSRWTSDMAINYYKTVLGIAAQLFGMILLVGIGKSILDNFYTNMDAGLSISELGVLLIVSIVLLVLTNQVPALIAGIVSGAGVGSQGIGSLGAGAAMGAAGMAIAGAATAGGLIAAGATQMAGGAQALMSAASKASSNVAAGSDTLGKMMSGASSAGSFAEAAGISSSSSTGADGSSGSGSGS